MKRRFGTGKSLLRRQVILMLLAAGLSLPAFWLPGVSAAGGEEWVYSVEPGDNLWNLTERYLDGIGYWKRLQRLNNVQKPKRIPPGTKLRIPLDWMKLRPASAFVRDIYGTAERTAPGEDSGTPLEAGTVLNVGDRISVGAESNLVLEFADGSQLFLGRDTSAQLERVKKFSDSGLADTRVQLKEGRAENAVETRGSRYEVKTPSATTAVRGTDFRVSIAPEDPAVSRIEVLSGKVRVAGDGARTELTAGFGARVAEGAPSLQAKRLLPSPAITSPTEYTRRFPVDIRWKPLEGAESYRIQIRTLDSEGSILTDALSKINGYSASDLEDGGYEIRVRGIDSHGLEGQDGRLQFTLDARPEPPLPITPALGATVRSELPAFEWSRPLDADTYHFQLAQTDDFASPIIDLLELDSTRFDPDALEPGEYFWRIATRAGDEEGPFSPVQTFVLRPTPKAPNISTEGTDKEITLRWQAGRPDQRYRVQLGKDAEFHEMIEDRFLEVPEIALQRPYEKVFFRARVVDSDGYEGGWSTVNQIDPPPQPWWLMLIPFSVLLL